MTHSLFISQFLIKLDHGLLLVLVLKLVKADSSITTGGETASRTHRFVQGVVPIKVERVQQIIYFNVLLSTWSFFHWRYLVGVVVSIDSISLLSLSEVFVDNLTQL